MLSLPEAVTIVEVGPRDGLQNESALIPTETKVAFIDALSGSGLRRIEVTAFVRPDRIPQLADAVEVCQQITRADGVIYSALVPNERGLDRASEAGLNEIAVFCSASETHNRKNIECSIEEAMERFRPVVQRALASKMPVRGYVSTAFGCPYEGPVSVKQVVSTARALLDLGVYQVSLGDTTGMGDPVSVSRVVSELSEHAAVEQIALHLHDTRGTALANALAGSQLGVTTFDASVGGLGGCPYAPGATGNAATDELVAMFEAMGVRTGVSVEGLRAAVELVEPALGKRVPSRWLQAERGTEDAAR
ncbi:MAG: hydroxymethylglutaryl-CoA lyase [Actinomycetota bacterium]